MKKITMATLSLSLLATASNAVESDIYMSQELPNLSKSAIVNDDFVSICAKGSNKFKQNVPIENIEVNIYNLGTLDKVKIQKMEYINDNTLCICYDSVKNKSSEEQYLKNSRLDINYKDINGTKYATMIYDDAAVPNIKPTYY